MPLYEYHCPACQHRFDKLQPMSAAGADCPRCAQPAKRALSVFAARSSGADSGGDFSPMNLPPLAGGGCCGGGCGCGH